MRLRFFAGARCLRQAWTQQLFEVRHDFRSVKVVFLGIPGLSIAGLSLQFLFYLSNFLCVVDCAVAGHVAHQDFFSFAACCLIADEPFRL